MNKQNDCKTSTINYTSDPSDLFTRLNISNDVKQKYERKYEKSVKSSKLFFSGNDVKIIKIK